MYILYIYILDLDPVLNQTFQGVFARLIWQQDGEQHFSDAGEIGDVFRRGWQQATKKSHDDPQSHQEHTKYI